MGGWYWVGLDKGNVELYKGQERNSSDTQVECIIILYWIIIV